MRVLAAVLGAVTVLLVLAEFFVTYLLPRRVKRDPRLARQVYVLAWRPWRALARRMPPAAADTFLGLFGPIALITVLGLWTVGMIMGFAALQYSVGSPVGGPRTGFDDDIAFSAAAFFSANPDHPAHGGAGHALYLVEAASGFLVLFIVIGYLPSVYQAFSRREVPVSQLDARAGSPPTAGALLVRAGRRGGWPALDAYLRDWETWAAELMETHLSYPLLAYFRSQHLRQNWLSALVSIVDCCAFALASAPPAHTEGAELTFALGRHALADLTYAFRARPSDRGPDRLGAGELAALRAAVAEAGLELRAGEEAQARLTELRGLYEPYAQAMAATLELPLPEWTSSGEELPNWRRTAWGLAPRRSLP